jgi:hypothetical protein
MTKKINYDLETGTASTLENFSKGRHNTTKDNEGKHFTDIKNIQFDGRTVWEFSHPTFVSVKRKSIVVCPRKAGHSSFRRALHVANEDFDDDWHWLSGHLFHPSHWLSEEEFWKLAFETHYANESKGHFQTMKILKRKLTGDPLQDHYALIVDDKETRKFLGKAYEHRLEIIGNLSTGIGTESDRMNDQQFRRPMVMADYFKDWKKYLVVREPWDRFISGLITELDNGIYTPWHVNILKSKENWEEAYIRMKRLLMWNNPNNILLGTWDGPQTDHTHILSGWKWDGKTIFDVYDHFIPCNHEVVHEFNKDGSNYNIAWQSLKDGSSMLKKFKELDLLPEDLNDGSNSSENEHFNDLWQHVNITSPERRLIMDEAINNDDDLKPFFDACNELIQDDINAIGKNNSKFV